MVRLIGPKVAVPAIRAGGAVAEPFPSISMVTFGYCFLNPSAQRLMTLLSVSEPTLLMLPEIPWTGLYSGRFLSTATCATALPAQSAPARITPPTAAIHFRLL